MAAPWRAAIVGAVDHDAVNTAVAHVAEGDLLQPLRHLDQSTSAARFIAELFGFLILIQ